MLEISKTAITSYCQLQFVCAGILLYLVTKTIIYYNKERKGDATTVKFVYAAYAAYILMILMDAAWALLEYHGASVFAVYLVNIIWHACLMSGPAIFMWCFERETNPNGKHTLGQLILGFGPVVLAILFTASSPWTKLVFSVDSTGHYTRGPLFLFAYAVATVYLIILTIRSFYLWVRAEIKADKKLYLAFLLFPVPIIIANTLQVFVAYGFTSIGVTISLGLSYALIVNATELEYLKMMKALCEDFEGVFMVNVDKDYVRPYRLSKAFERSLNKMHGDYSYSARVASGIRTFIVYSDKLRVSREFEAEYVFKQLRKKKTYTSTFKVLDENGFEKYMMAKFVLLDREDGRFFLLGIRSADKEIRDEVIRKRDDDLRTGLINILAQEYTTLLYYNFRKDECLQSYIGKIDATANKLLKKDISFREKFKYYIEAYVHPEDREKLMEVLDVNKALKKLSDRRRFSIAFRRDFGGEYRYMEMLVAKPDEGITEPENVVIGFYPADKDFNEKLEYENKLKEARARADAANEAKSAFLFNMSHDIRTPMNAIIGFTLLAKKHMHDPNALNDYLEKIDLSGRHLLSLINNVLDMSRVESGKIESESAPVDIVKELRAVMDMCAENAKQKNITFRCYRKDIKSPLVYCDYVHIEQIMINIISNAIKYTNKGGSVSCTIRELKNSKRGYSSFLFTVKDNGIGISEEFLKKIYDPFTREQNTTSSGVEGTGLGMSIVKNLVELLGGEINIESKLGEGTKVTVSLTLKQVRANVKEKEVKEPKYVSLQKKKVLVVEDNDLNREIISSILREEGLEVVEATDGADAIDLLEHNGVNSVDFILMDIQMPVMDGYEATAKIREMDGSKAVPIIALSANAFEEDKRKSIKSGMNAHLSKPINIRELMKTLEEFGRGD